MSEPSSEAKEAAKEHAYNPSSYSGEMFCEGYDAATAKRAAPLVQWLKDIGYSDQEIAQATQDYSWVTKRKENEK